MHSFHRHETVTIPRAHRSSRCSSPLPWPRPLLLLYLLGNRVVTFSLPSPPSLSGELLSYVSVHEFCTDLRSRSRDRGVHPSVGCFQRFHTDPNGSWSQPDSREERHGEEHPC